MPSLPTITFDPEKELWLSNVRSGQNPQEEYGPNGAKATVWWECAWVKRYEAITWLLGTQVVDAGRVKRLNPQAYPERTGWYAVSAKPVGRKLLGTNPTTAISTKFNPLATMPYPRLPKYETAVIEAEYQHLPYAIQEDADTPVNDEYARNTSQGEFVTSADMLQLPGSVLKYTTYNAARPQNEPIPFGTTRVLPLAEIKYTWHRVPFEAWVPGSPLWNRTLGTPAVFDGGGELVTDEVLPSLGAVNKTDIADFRPGSLLYSAVRPIRRPSPLGFGFEWDIEMTWSLDPNEWNRKLYSPPGLSAADRDLRRWYYVSATGTYYATGSVPDGDSLYIEREFADLFKVV